MPIPIADLMEEAKCFCSTGGSNAERAIMALLQRIAESSAGGSQFISGAGAPAAAPANPDAPAQYFDTTNDFTYNWNLGTQTWVVVPKKVVAMITSDGTNNQIVTVLENTIGPIVWTREDVGFVVATLAGAFPQQTTVLRSPSMSNESQLIIGGDWTMPNQVFFAWFSAGVAADLFNLNPVTIEVYP